MRRLSLRSLPASSVSAHSADRICAPAGVVDAGCYHRDADDAFKACGEHLFVPQWTEYVNEYRVRHLWECEACDYTFETAATYAAA